MRVLGKKRILDFIVRYPDCKKALESLIVETEFADWRTPHDIKNRYPKASVIDGQNIIFNICGNRYRVWLKITYQNKTAIIVKIGTHKEYDKWEIKK